MKISDFLKRKKTGEKEMPPIVSAEERFRWIGKDFEFLITGEIGIPEEDYDRIMTPNTFSWTKVNRDNWSYYKVGEDEFTYSWEIPGIQMTFNVEITFEKAKKIADEVIDNIKTTGQEAELIVLDSSNIHRFDL
jgi:hypothetical protein